MRDILESFFAELAEDGHGWWANDLRTAANEIMAPATNGHMRAWEEAIQRLPPLSTERANLNMPAVTVGGPCSDNDRNRLLKSLRAFHPWRKGPFDLFGIEIDSEWRSDQKWARVAQHVELANKDVLDVGCGNGYFGWRMLGAGARRVVGLEPYPLYNMQHRLVKTFLPDLPNYVVPATDKALLSCTELFDVCFSMGVLYHSKNPIGHLESLRSSLRRQGAVVVESLVVDGDQQTALIPEDRYAKMRNVWLIPSVLMLSRLLYRAGFRNVEVVDIAATTQTEQRSTEWMTFESLCDFLDPSDQTRTVEGLPAPKRAMLVARKP